MVRKCGRYLSLLTVPPAAPEHDVVPPPVRPTVEVIRLSHQNLPHVLLRADHHAVGHPELDAEDRAVDLERTYREG